LIESKICLSSLPRARRESRNLRTLAFISSSRFTSFAAEIDKVRDASLKIYSLSLIPELEMNSEIMQGNLGRNAAESIGGADCGVS
jgi:hypothetical protein